MTLPVDSEDEKTPEREKVGCRLVEIVSPVTDFFYLSVHEQKKSIFLRAGAGGTSIFRCRGGLLHKVIPPR